jgi:hypothetical protein
MNHNQIVYLMHLIEFVDLSDGLPAELAIHPNVNKSWPAKRDFLTGTVDRILKKYEPVKTIDMARHYAEA